MDSMLKSFTADSAVRCDVCIAENLPEITRSYVRKLFDEDRITVNKKTVRPAFKVKPGDEVCVNLPEPKELSAKEENIPLDIVYEDKSLLVINKPRKMVVHPAAGNESGTLVNALLYHCKGNLSAINGCLRPGIVHRIDKDTTGLLVVAKTNAAHLFLSAQLEDKTLNRTYYAILHSNIQSDSLTLDFPIARSQKDRKKMAVAKEGGRNAVTHLYVLERFKKYTYVKCRLETGRTHQIRVHTAHIGHPILGDKTYGVKKEEYKLSGQLLHAGEIGFIHPESKEEMHFSAPLPDDFSAVLSDIRAKYGDNN